MKKLSWKLHLNSPPSKVYKFLNSDEGRASFWAESAVESDGIIHFKFINSWSYDSIILDRIPIKLFKIDYFNSLVCFQLEEDVQNRTILTLVHENIDPEDFEDIKSGWVSVLLALKAAVDFEVDLRNHNPNKNWDQGFVEN